MSTSATPAAAAPKQVRVLACVLCQHRKIKCDRSTPCSNCLKANVTCTPSVPAPARKRRRPNQDLQERLAKCEELLKQYAGHSGGLPQGTQTPPERHLSHPVSEPTMAVSPTGESGPKWQAAGKVVHDEGSVRFMDSYLWATVYDELQAMKELIDTDDPEELSTLGSEEHVSEAHFDPLFPMERQCYEDGLPPDSSQVFRLWQLFLDRVNPLTKIIHVPSVQPFVIEALTSMEKIPLKYQALLFSIYTMAAMSLSDVECLQMLGMPREKALQRFTTGLKIAINRFNFLKNHDMVVLQALVLYLVDLLTGTL
jgi:hypothetical protein